MKVTFHFTNNLFYIAGTTKCVPLVPPMKGAIACDNWEGGQYCQIQCQNGTELSSVSLNKLYVCTLHGDWSIAPPEIKSCTGQLQKR